MSHDPPPLLALPQARAVRLQGRAVFTCVFSLSVRRDYDRGIAIAQSTQRAFDGRLRTCRWRSAKHWTLVGALRKDLGDGLVQIAV